jgi:hypothetical protein
MVSLPILIGVWSSERTCIVRKAKAKTYLPSISWDESDSLSRDGVLQQVAL